MSGIGLIFVCFAPLATIVSPDTVGKVTGCVFAGIGIIIILMGAL